jgi:hypothetical protein
LIEDYTKQLLPFKKENQYKYLEYLSKILEHTRSHCSTSATANYFLDKMNHLPNVNNILLITCDKGVNYTREMLWIGLKRLIQEKNGIAVEYPKINYLYESFKGEKEKMHGFGFNYLRKLKDDYDFEKEEIISKIKERFWDLIIFGKVGPDELWEGSLPNLPLWDIINENYSKEEIVFLYGGDECVDLTYDNKYSRHILYHGNFGHCFVRELKR